LNRKDRIVKNTLTTTTDAPVAKPDANTKPDPKAMPKRMKPFHYALVDAATACGGAMRSFGLAAVAALEARCHDFMQQEAIPYLTSVMTGQGVARPTADAAARVALVGWAAGPEAIEGLPADGLRHVASVGKTLPEAERKALIVATLDKAKRDAKVPGKPSIAELRKAAGKDGNGTQNTVRLANLAMSLAGNDHAKAIDLLKGAIENLMAQMGTTEPAKPGKGDPSPEEIAARAKAIRSGKGQA
jgi:hypothetical protein